MRDFTVKKGVMGYVVNIGCQTAGFSNKKDLIAAITEYVNDPEKTEKKYYKETAPPPAQWGTATYATIPEGITLVGGNTTASQTATVR
jgi:hypothetical protein